MSLHQTSSKQTSRSLNQPGAASTRLQGGTLMLARGVWIAGAVAVLVIFFASLPANFAYLHNVGTNETSFSIRQLTPDGLRKLQVYGLSVDFYATYITGCKVIFVAAWFALGGLIFWRKSDDRMAFFASFALIMFPIGFTNTIALEALPPTWLLPVECVQFLGGISLSVFFYVFPDGRFVPSWTRWLLIGWVIEESYVSFFALTPVNPFVRSLIVGFLFIVLLVSLVAVQFYRYRRVSNPVQRQQTKWVVFGMTVAVLGFAATISVGTTLFPADARSGPFETMIAYTALDLFLLLIPFSIGLAILRSRLWEIDVIINRSLVYGTLTVSLALIYVGSVLALQTLLGSFTEGNQFAIVGSTLVIAVLFQPLRRRIQAIIDRRFYRQKYDAARTLEGFSATLRSEVDLQQLREQLVGLVEETMQPTHVSLWLRPPEQIGKQSAAWINTPPASPREK
jgi:hypothetical protein